MPYAVWSEAFAAVEGWIVIFEDKGEDIVVCQELEIFHNIDGGREHKMTELKLEIERLEKKICELK